MKLDYLDNYNGLNENIVRLFDFDKAEAIQFRNLIQQTVINAKMKLNLAEVEFVDTEDYNLIFGLFKTDEGILTKDNKTFFCILTINSFLEMITLLAPFCEKETKSHQYLYDVDTPTDLLFAPYAN